MPKIFRTSINMKTLTKISSSGVAEQLCPKYLSTFSRMNNLTGQLYTIFH